VRGLISIFGLIVILATTGCQTSDKARSHRPEGDILLSLDFEQGEVLRYKFVSSRDVTVQWQSGEQEAQDKIDQSAELLEMVVAYQVVEANKFGLSTIEASIESVEVRQRGIIAKHSSKAMETLKGESWRFRVDPTGKIEDYSELSELIKKAGDNAFIERKQGGRVKLQDMIADFSNFQWFLWDSISSIKSPELGVSAGYKWESRLPIPTPMVTRQGREVEYTLWRVIPSAAGKLAVINSEFSPADSVEENWPPMPYTGTIRMAGTFGFLTNYTLLELSGKGEEKFNIDAGRSEGFLHEYTASWQSQLLFLITGVKPKVTINQRLSMELLQD